MITKEEYRTWYSRRDVQFEIIKFSQDRELFLLSKTDPKTSVRCLKAHNVQQFDIIMGDTSAVDNLYNVYASVARYSSPPHLHCYVAKRDAKGFRADHSRYMNGYDFVIDIDAPDHEPLSIDFAKMTLIDIMDLYDKYDVPYEVRFTGKGFHVIVPSWAIDREGYADNFRLFDPKSRFNLLAKVAKSLNIQVSELIDTGIYDSRRVVKIPYTLSLYEDRCLVCMPLFSRQEAETFTLAKYDYKNWMKTSVRGKGTFMFNKDGSFKRFGADYYGIR